MPSPDTNVAAPKPRRIRVAHVVFSLGTGGLETGLVNLLSRLDPAEFEHRIYCMKALGPNAERALALGVPSEQVGTLEGKNRGILCALARRFRTFRPDIVHSRNFGTVDAILAAKLARVPAVVHGEHGFDTADPDGADRRRRFIRGCLSPFVDHYLTVSKDLERWLLAHRGRFRGKVSAVHNGVDVERYRPLARVRGAGPGPLVVGTVGRLTMIKDQASLLEAFATVAARHPTARLLLVGDGPLRADLEARAKTLGIQDRVEFPGAHSDVRAAYDRLDLFVLPSLNEGISNTILEAMAAGLPVIATAVGGNPELVVDGETGRLVPKQDPATLAEAIAGYLARPETIALHGRAGRDRAVREFSLDAMAAGYRRVYRAVLHQGT